MATRHGDEPASRIEARPLDQTHCHRLDINGVPAARIAQGGKATCEAPLKGFRRIESNDFGAHHDRARCDLIR